MIRSLKAYLQPRLRSWLFPEVTEADWKHLYPTKTREVPWGEQPKSEIPKELRNLLWRRKWANRPVPKKLHFSILDTFDRFQKSNPSYGTDTVIKDDMMEFPGWTYKGYDIPCYKEGRRYQGYTWCSSHDGNYKYVILEKELVDRQPDPKSFVQKELNRARG